MPQREDASDGYGAKAGDSDEHPLEAVEAASRPQGWPPKPNGREAVVRQEAPFTRRPRAALRVMKRHARTTARSHDAIAARHPLRGPFCHRASEVVSEARGLTPAPRNGASTTGVGRRVLRGITVAPE
jgi:hypothetical protein